MAAQTIQSLASRTPLIHSAQLSQLTGGAVYLKLETLQPVGAFKLRGAANRILNLPVTEQQRGVITVSTGNHGRAVAYVAKSLGIPATVCISSLVPANKVEALRALNAEVVIHGQSQDDAAEKAVEIQQERGLSLIHPFDDPFIIAGQGTIGLEILQDLPQIDSVLVPLSGGGLISGIALALKSASPAIRVTGISMEDGAAMAESLRAGHPVEVTETVSLADSLGGGIGLDNQFTFSMVQKYVDEVVSVPEDDIARGMAFAFHEHHLITEGAGAVGIAALLGEKIPAGKNTVIIISGGNVDLTTLMHIAQNYRS